MGKKKKKNNSWIFDGYIDSRLSFLFEKYYHCKSEALTQVSPSSEKNKPGFKH